MSHLRIKNKILRKWDSSSRKNYFLVSVVTVGRYLVIWKVYHGCLHLMFRRQNKGQGWGPGLCHALGTLADIFPGPRLSEQDTRMKGPMGTTLQGPWLQCRWLAKLGAKSVSFLPGLSFLFDSLLQLSTLLTHACPGSSGNP